jgi:phosphoribosylglycinamide formyltransferase-1
VKKIVILISGRGSNMEAIVAACRTEGWSAQVASVIASKPGAAGLQFAAATGIPTAIVDSKSYSSRALFEAALAEAIDAHAPDCVVLAGFMRVLTEQFVHRYADRMLNIHPSLLPAFPGLDTHARALAAGVRVHGATVHFVSPIVDAGPIVAQAVVPLRAGDTADALAARVLAAEHRLFPKAIEWFLSGRAVLADGRVTLHEAIAPEALMVCA